MINIIFLVLFLYCIIGIIHYYIWRVWPNDIRGDEDDLACTAFWSFIWPISWVVLGIVMFMYWVLEILLKRKKKNTLCLLGLRELAHEKGLIILEHDIDKFLITNNGTEKYLIEILCKNLKKVEKELKKIKI